MVGCIIYMVSCIICIYTVALSQFSLLSMTQNRPVIIFVCDLILTDLKDVRSTKTLEHFINDLPSILESQSARSSFMGSKLASCLLANH